MKRFLLIVCFCTGLTSFSQEEIKFSRAEQAQIMNILNGTRTAVVFDSNGAMRLDRPRKIRRVRVLPGGGFELPGGTAAWALIKSHWVLISDDVAEIGRLRTKLGAEKFQQLHEIISSKTTR